MATSIAEIDANKIQAVLDGVDHVASVMERKWGSGRLRLLVDHDTRARFDRQMAKWNDTVWPVGKKPDARAVEETGNAMIRGWQALDRLAIEAGHEPLPPQVMETTLDDGTVLAVVNSQADAWLVPRDGRRIVVWTLAEVARVASSNDLINRIKTTFEGSTVTAVRDPTAGGQFDFDIGDQIPF